MSVDAPPASAAEPTGVRSPDALPPGSAATGDAVAQMVSRCLDPAMGFCMRGLGPTTDSDATITTTDIARVVVMKALRVAARHRVASDDSAVQDVMRGVAQFGLDALESNPRTVTLPAGVDVDELLPGAAGTGTITGGSELSLAAVQDANAAARSADRQVVFAVLAAGMPPEDAALLLGRTEVEVQKSLRRALRRMADSSVTSPIPVPAR